MKNKLLNKIITIILVSLIGLTSISSFNHVSAEELDNFSYTNQLVSTSNINKLDYPPVPPSPNNPKTWIGVLTALFTVIGIKNSLSFDKTINVLQNGFADNRTGVFVDSLIKNNPSFNFDKFASDNNVLSGNYTNINPSLIKNLHIDPKLCIDLEKHNTNINYNGGNKNYYTNNDYSSTNNYSVFNSSTNNINYTYNNQHYNYTVNNMFYNYVTNEYTFNITNNQNITYINNYNNTTIISPSGQSQKLYYKLPDGSNSLNLTEEQAKKGYKTSLHVASYSNGFDDDDLNFLFHFDGNEYDSAYPILDYSLKAIPNSVDYIDSSNPSFNQAIAFTDSFDLSVEGSNYNNYYSFRIYPQINDKWSLNINGVHIASRFSKIDTKYDYVEWDSKSSTAYWHMITVVNNLPNQCPDTWTNFGNTYDRSTEKYTTSCGYKISNTSTTTQRTYNIINNKLFEDSGTNLLNYNQWNFISIDTSGKVFINGVDTDITVSLDQFKISVTGDSLTYIDELVSFKSDHSSVAPSLPYDSNITYYLPGIEYVEKKPTIFRVMRRSVSSHYITPDFNKGYDSFDTYQRNGSNPTWSYNFTTPVNITGFNCNVVNNRGSVNISVSSNGSVIGSISGDGNGTVNLDTPVLATSFSIYMDGANYNGSGYYVYSIEPFTIYYSKPVTKYSVNLSSNGNGSVSGGGSYDSGSVVSISATPDSGYRFKQWSDGNTDNPRSITVNSDISLSATFELIPPTKYSVNLSSNGNGSVSGGGRYDSGSVVSISATPDSGYRFKQWSDGNTDNPRSITVNSDISLSATFELIPPTKYSVNLSSNGNGSVSGGGSYDSGSVVSISATPDSGYRFKQWSDGNTDNPRSITVNSDISLSATFEVIPPTKYSVNLSSNGNGSVSGGGSYDSGSVVSISATPDSGYRFKQWSDGNTDNPRSITVNSDISLSATFEVIPPYEEKVVSEYNNLLLIQSLIPCLSWKFGGIRPSNPNNGDVYCSVNENGNITSVQQFNGIEWVKVVGSIYNDALGLWVNAVGFNIFVDNWSYQDIDYRADDPNINILIRFLTSQFNKITSLLDSIIEKIKGISLDETTINNYQTNYNVDINTNIDNLINTSKDYDKDIDLDSPSYNVDDSILTDINNLAVGSKGIFKALDDSGFSILYLAPLILLLVGLLL